MEQWHYVQQESFHIREVCRHRACGVARQCTSAYLHASSASLSPSHSLILHLQHLHLSRHHPIHKPLLPTNLDRSNPSSSQIVNRHPDRNTVTKYRQPFNTDMEPLTPVTMYLPEADRLTRCQADRKNFHISFAVTLTILILLFFPLFTFIVKHRCASTQRS